MKALLSIKPEFVYEIMSGKKKYEYRKKIFKQDVESVVIYASMPVGRIVGEFTIGEIISSSPKEIWKETKEYSGISYKDYCKYFKGRKDAYAIQIKELKRYERPIDPYETFDHFVPPQSYKYIYDENPEKSEMIKIFMA